jgi:HD-GYP domain-containing protein (c-di-GMP phosphodiesterase class II)
MIVPVDHFDQPMVSPRLRARLGRLGLCVLSVTPDGRIAPLDPLDGINQLIVSSAIFNDALQEHHERLVQGVGQVIELWPGLWIIPLPLNQRRRRSEDRFGQPLLLAVVWGPKITEAPQLRAICGQNQLDYSAFVARIEPAQLVDRDEAHRLASMLVWMQEDAVEIDRRLSELQTMSQELSESYEELSLLYKLSTNMTINQVPAAFLLDACDELLQVVGLKWFALQLIDEPRLEDLAGEVFCVGTIDCEKSLLKPLGRQLIEKLPSDGAPMVVDDTASLDIPMLADLSKTMLLVPLRHEDQPLGILYGGDKLDGTHISSIDSKLCDSLTNSMSIFLSNVMLYDDMQAMFLGTLHALTSAIDAKDSYTHGHSERVALLSRLLAEGSGLKGDLVERIYIAGLIHDVGKIGVPEAVLTNPGRLTKEEFDQIKLHPEIGAVILKDIRQMQDLIPGVLHHHERWDGGGYPHSLKGEDIPLMGRVIGLADAFDAMSSNRTYRQAMGLDDVLEEITACSGTQFDPDLAEVFLKLNFDSLYALIEKHQDTAKRRSA